MVPAWLVVLVGCVAVADGPSPTEPHGVSTTTVPATTTTTITLEQGLARYRQCLSDEGVSIDDIKLDGLGRPRLALAMKDLDLTNRVVIDALDTCGPELTTGPLDLTADPRLRDLVQSSLEAFSACVRAQGVAGFPDPVLNFSGVGSPFPPSRIPWTDAALPNAVTACKPAT
jgi:hypothetical protein